MTRGHSAAADAFSIAAAPAAPPLPFDLEPGDPPNPTGPFPSVVHGSAAARALHLRRAAADVLRRRRRSRRRPLDGGRRRSRTSPPPTASNTSVGGLRAVLRHLGGGAARGGDRRRSCCPATRAPRRRRARGVRRRPRSTSRRRASTAAPATGSCAPTACSRTRARRRSRSCGRSTPALTPITGDGDAYLEPGETATLRAAGDQRRRRHGDRRQRHGQHRRPAGDGHAARRVLRRPAAGATRAQDFTLALATGYPLGKRVRLAVRVTFAGVLSPTTATFTRPDRPAGDDAAAFAYTGPAVPIPDASAAGASVTIPVAGVGYASQGHVLGRRRDLHDRRRRRRPSGIDHTFVGDLTGTLIAPAGATARLFQRAGGGGNNLCQVVFDDAAAAPFATRRSPRDAPFTGTWRPNEPLAALLDALGRRQLDVPRRRRRAAGHGLDPRRLAGADGVRGGLSASSARRRRPRCCRGGTRRGGGPRGRRP